MEGGKEANYWPGFVDALSNVVLTLVFVLVVFVFALVIASNKVDKQVDAIVQQKLKESGAAEKALGDKSMLAKGLSTDSAEQKKESGSTEKAAGEKAMLTQEGSAAEKAGGEKALLQQQLDQALAELKTLKSKSSQSQSEATTEEGQASIAKFKKSDASQEAKVDAKSQEMIITFNQNAISLTDDTVKSIGTFLDKYKDKDGKISAKVTLESSIDPTAPSSTQAKETELGRDLNVRNTLLNDKADAENITIKNVDPSQQAGTYNWVKIHVDK